MTPTDIEREKLEVERLRLELERERLKLDQRSRWPDLVSKVGIPGTLLLLSAATFWGSYEQAERRSVAENDFKKAELAIQQSNLGLRQSEHAMAKERHTSDFIQAHYKTYIAPDAGARDSVIALVSVTFSDQLEAQGVIRRLDAMRTSMREVSVDTLTQHEQSRVLLEAGRQSVREGKFGEAVQRLTSHLVLEPGSAWGWNSKAYALLRMNDHTSALHSISQANSLSPTDPLLQRMIAINAAKILCASGRTQDGISYVNTSAAAIPGFTALAKRDTELTSMCGFTWSVA